MSLLILPTQIGYDSDDPMSNGEVGKVGVAIDTLEDMERLFKGIRLDEVSTSMTINATGFILLAFYIALAKKQGADVRKISGTIQNDILKEYAARGTYIYPPKPSIGLSRIFLNIVVRKFRNGILFLFRIQYWEAGSTAVEELAFTLSNGKAYLKAALQRGWTSIFLRSGFRFFNAHNHLFEEVAKFRAARRIWAKMTAELGATLPEAPETAFSYTNRWFYISATAHE